MVTYLSYELSISRVRPLLLVVALLCGSGVAFAESLEAMAQMQMVDAPGETPPPDEEEDIVIAPSDTAQILVPPYNPANPPKALLVPSDPLAFPEDDLADPGAFDPSAEAMD